MTDRLMTERFPRNPMGVLEEALQDEDKILKALVDRAQNLYAAYKDPKLRTNSMGWPPALTTINQAIDEAANRCRNIVREAYSNGPNFVLQDKKKRRVLRESLRLLNFSARFVAELIQNSGIKTDTNWHDRPGDRIENVRLAMETAQRMARLCSPGPDTLTHPQFEKWHNLVGRCQRRIGAIWIEMAQASEAIPETRTDYKYRMNRRQWDQYQSVLYSTEPDAAPLMERINGVLNGLALALEQTQFEDLQVVLRGRFKSPLLADKLKEVAEKLGGPLTQEDALARSNRGPYFMAAR